MSDRQADIRLIVGLGNPGEKYQETRHNAGFLVLDQLAGRWRGQFGFEKRFNSDVATVRVLGETRYLLKPLTFMNLSGDAVGTALRYYRLKPEQLLVVHDELDLAPGVLRVKLGGGHGGHNGLRDANTKIGSQDYWRLRVGIGHPGHKDRVVPFVLSRPGREEQRRLECASKHAVAEFEGLLTDQGRAKAIQTLHRYRPEGVS